MTLRLTAPFDAAARARTTGGALVKVTIPDRLTGNMAQHAAIAGAIRRALVRGSGTYKEMKCRVEVEPFEIDVSPFTLDSKGVPLTDDSERQFTGTLPSLLCVHIDDLSDEQLAKLFRAEESDEQTGLGAAMAKLLWDRPKLHCVFIWSERKMNVTGQDIRSRNVTSLEEKGTCFTFRSRRYEGAPDVGDAVFGTL